MSKPNAPGRETSTHVETNAFPSPEPYQPKPYEEESHFLATSERIERIWGRVERDVSSRANRSPKSSGATIAFRTACVGAMALALGFFLGRFNHERRTGEFTLVEPDSSRAMAPVAVPASSPSHEQAANIAPQRVKRELPATSAQEASRGQSSVDIDVTKQAHSLESAGALGTPEWLRFYRTGEYSNAFRSIEQSPGGAEAAIASCTSAGELMNLSGVARKSAHPEVAIAALERVVQEYGSDPNASIAAFTLGDLYERAGDSGKAMHYREAARELSPSSPLADDARCKQLRAQLRTATHEEAANLAHDYLKAFPSGACKEEMALVGSADNGDASPQGHGDSGESGAH